MKYNQPNYGKIMPLIFTICASTFVSVIGIAATKVPNATAQYAPPTVSPLNGTWKLQWRMNRNSLDGILTMSGNTGTMTLNVRYPNGQIDVVQQNMLLQSTTNGFILSGQNPVYAGTNMPIESYIPDSFLIQPASDLESWSVKSCDRTERCSRVNMRYVGSASPFPL